MVAAGSLAELPPELAAGALPEVLAGVLVEATAMEGLALACAAFEPAALWLAALGLGAGVLAAAC